MLKNFADSRIVCPKVGFTPLRFDVYFTWLLVFFRVLFKFKRVLLTQLSFILAFSLLCTAGLLQMHARTPRYASHRARLESFPDRITSPPLSAENRESCAPQKLRVARPSPSELASAGFFHTGSGDETICPACGLGLRDWQATDQPEACHLAYSTAEVSLSATGGGSDRSSTPALPCLYLAVHRLLSSELPLARKSLVSACPVQSVCSLPGVTTFPVKSFDNTAPDSASSKFATLADRLRAIAQIMFSSPPQAWPIENARVLGHSDDLIVLALWRLQMETAGVGLACPPSSALRLDPQATADLLRSILRLQEGFDAGVQDFPDFDGFVGDDEEDSDADLTAEDAETAAFSLCRISQRSRSVTASELNSSTSPLSVDSSGLTFRKIRLPRFYQFISWWSNRWPLE
ncbi:uncharacterized protein DEA37_0014670 [Paragonimus westermani]|uniref:Transmembrane protein n=1 Tax=Paragonimus westermani TaxID=34504 RepID=A0A5J4NVG2_9TREM|nr:uncharacterized protein DEA37_0014670 [Paragonimus westermani]